MMRLRNQVHNMFEIEKKKIVQYGILMQQKNLTVATSGNISLKDPRAGAIVISPSDIPYEKTKTEDIVVMGEDGKKLEGMGKPSSELDMHQAIYAHRSDVYAVVHTHSYFASVFACLNEIIPPILPNIEYIGDEIKVLPFMESHNRTFAQAVVEQLDTNYGLILGNHGAICCGPTLEYAFDAACVLEYIAEIYYKCLISGKNIRVLTDPELNATKKRFAQKREKLLQLYQAKDLK